MLAEIYLVHSMFFHEKTKDAINILNSILTQEQN